MSYVHDGGRPPHDLVSSWKQGYVRSFASSTGGRYYGQAMLVQTYRFSSVCICDTLVYPSTLSVTDIRLTRVCVCICGADRDVCTLGGIGKVGTCGHSHRCCCIL